jgi:DNA-nicking Smr family endonuclease
LSRPVAAAHDHAPMIEERLSHQPLRMDRRTVQQMLRGKLKPEARIDLHGMTLAEAHPELIRFVLSAQRAGRRMILVITGKGKLRDDHGPIPQRMGVLRHQLPHWLTQPPLGSIVLQVAPAHQKHGGGGAFYVYLRRS